MLLPPVAYACVGEEELRGASYVRDEEGRLRLEADADWDGKGDVDGEANGDSDDEETGQESIGKVPFATWDPDFPEREGTRYSHLARPVRVSLEKGDMLYLPAFW